MAQADGTIISSEAAISSEECYKNLVSKLPKTEGWSVARVQYNNYWVHPLIAENIMRLQDSFKPRRDDVILATNPKCGTTWLKATAFTLTTRSQYTDLDSHPLLFHHPQELVPFIEVPREGKDLTYVETLSSPRLLATHMPLSLWPEAMRNCGCRVVYICREPKDTLVSWWHFDNKMSGGKKIHLETMFNMFCEGISPCGPFWNHCLEYFRESITMPDKVLFLKYEDMMAEPVNIVMRLATFLGVPFTDEEKKARVPEKLVRLCSFEILSGLKVNQIGDLAWISNAVEKSAFFRRGKVGDWINHMSPEMGRKLDGIMEEKLKGSGLIL